MVTRVMDASNKWFNDGIVIGPSGSYGITPAGVATLGVSTLGVTTATSFSAIIAGGGVISALAASATVPSLIPDRSDTDTGTGQAAPEQYSIIAGGVEAVRYSEASSQILMDTSLHAGLTAGTTHTQAHGLALLSSYNEIATV